MIGWSSSVCRFCFKTETCKIESIDEDINDTYGVIFGNVIV